MNYQQIFKLAIQLISSPAKAWEEISLHEDKRSVFTAFVYPMIGLCALSVFLGVIFRMGWSGPESFQTAMTQCCVVAVSLFAGYFLASYIINELGTRFWGFESDLPLIHQFAGYSLVVSFLTSIVLGLFPDFGLLALLFQFYIVYIVWVGAGTLLNTREESRLGFTLVSSVLLIACPAIIEFLFNKLLFLLN